MEEKYTLREANLNLRISMLEAKNNILKKKPVLVGKHRVTRIITAKDKGVVVVIFDNGDKRVMHLAKGDKYSVYIATCVAIGEHIYGSNSNLTKTINSLTEEQK